jgi:Protein of unknown function (DUF3047)
MKPGVLGATLAMALACCAARADGDNLLTSPIGGGSEPAPPWHVVGLPKQTKPFTQFRVVSRDGARVLEVEAKLSYGNLVHELPASSKGNRLSWRWRVERGIAAGDPTTRSGDDHPIAVCAMFDVPLASLPFVERQMLRAARSMSNDDVPTATLCYTWDERLAPGTAIESPFTRRVRYLVLRGQGDAQREWRREERDLRADFQRLFGEEAKGSPPLQAVAVAGDADNTQGQSLALLADLVLQ